MPKFRWEGTTRGGDPRRGVMTAANREAVAQRLRADDITPKRITRAMPDLSNLALGSGVSESDKLIFTRQLATMIDAGLPLVQCLDILANQSPNKRFAKVLHGVKASVEEGATFADSLRKYPRVFDELFVNLIQAGEVGGILDTILNRLSTYIEKAVKLKRQVKSAMIYPSAILAVAILVVVVMLTKVIPVFEEMYEQFDDAQLPGPTQFILGLSHGFIDNWYWFFGGALALFGLLTFMLRNPKGREVFDRGILRFPIIGSVLRKVVVARFTRTLGTLLSSGVPILDSLEICAKTAGNKEVQKAVMHARSKIAEGQDLAGPMASTGVFPGMVCQMVGVGEQTGAMDAMLQKIADFYEEEVDVAVAGLTSLMEPMMMVILGGIIGGMIVAMYLPVFELAGNIQ
jgi:type IV pilus assembly protein PilC